MNRDEYRGLPRFVLEAEGQAADEDGRSTPEIDRALSALASALPGHAPSIGAKGRLIASAMEGPMRYAPFFERLGQLFDLGRDAILRILQTSASPAAWVAGPHPAIVAMHFAGGPAVANLDTGLVRMPAGFVWPRHRHGGIERTLLLEGEYVEAGGRVYRAGDIHEMAPGSEHAFTVSGDSPLLLAVVLGGEIEMLEDLRCP